MKILHLPSSFFPQNTGGKEVLVYQWIKNMASDCEHKVLIHAPDPRVYHHDGIEVVVMPLPKPATRAAYFSKVYSDLGGFEQQLDDYQPDIAHFHDQNESGSLSHLMACQKRGIKTLVTYHSPGQSCIQRAQLFAGEEPCDGRIDMSRCTSCRYQLQGLPAVLANVMGAVDLPLGKFNLRATTKLFYDSWKEFYSRVNKVHIYSRWLEQVLLINGVAASKIAFTEMGGHSAIPDALKTPADKRVLRIVFVGRCTHIKGVHLLIEAVRKIPVEVDIEVHFFGPYFDQTEYGRQLQEMVQDDPRFIQPRLVAPDRIISELSTMDVCIIPSLWPETGPLSVFDAFAARLPIIGTRHAGIAERVKDGVDGLLFDWGSADDLAAKIALLARDTELLQRLKNGIEKKLTFEDMASSILDIYKTLR